MTQHEGVCAVVYNPELEKFLVLKRAEDKKFYPGRWEFPGGNIEDEEPEKTVLREVREETGLVGTVIRREGPFQWESKYGHVRTHPFLVKVDSSEVEMSREHSKYRWVEREELSELEMYPGNRKALEVLGLK